jgi:hypothetical protein
MLQTALNVKHRIATDSPKTYLALNPTLQIFLNSEVFALSLTENVVHIELFS